MNSVLDLFMGDPVYDDQKNVIRRDFGVKNIVAIMVVGFIGYSLMGEMKPISGKRIMKGGEGNFCGLVITGWLMFLCLMVIIAICALFFAGPSFFTGAGKVVSYVTYTGVAVIFIGWLFGFC